MAIEAYVVDDSTAKGGFGRAMRSIAVDSTSVRAALIELEELLPPDREPNGTPNTWRVDEVHMTVELKAEGGVRLIGSATVGLTGGIEVVYRRVPPDSD
jgi:hypothetical protein